MDEEAFRLLPSLLAEHCGARSCNVFWLHDDGDAAMMAHSGYYSDEQLLNYTSNFTEVDLWAAEATRDHRINRISNCDELVSHGAYEGSVFYNEWIREMGDDCFHCIGTAVETRSGAGVIGMHRGRTQGSFRAEHLAVLEENLVHLRRMLSVRGLISAGLRGVQQRDAMLDAVGYAYLCVTSSGRLVYANSAADALIRRGDGLTLHRGVLSATAPSADRRLKAALALATASHQPTASAVAVPRGGGGRHDLSLVPTVGPGGRRCVLITISSARSSDGTLAARLRALYGLTEAEAQIAVHLADGASPAEIAGMRHVSVATVRAQIQSTRAKLGCRRQTEIVVLVKSLPSLTYER